MLGPNPHVFLGEALGTPLQAHERELGYRHHIYSRVHDGVCGRVHGSGRCAYVLRVQPTCSAFSTGQPRTGSAGPRILSSTSISARAQVGAASAKLGGSASSWGGGSSAASVSGAVVEVDDGGGEADPFLADLEAAGLTTRRDVDLLPPVALSHRHGATPWGSGSGEATAPGWASSVGGISGVAAGTAVVSGSSGAGGGGGGGGGGKPFEAPPRDRRASSSGAPGLSAAAPAVPPLGDGVVTGGSGAPSGSGPGSLQPHPPLLRAGEGVVVAEGVSASAVPSTAPASVGGEWLLGPRALVGSMGRFGTSMSALLTTGDVGPVVRSPAPTCSFSCVCMRGGCTAGCVCM